MQDSRPLIPWNQRLAIEPSVEFKLKRFHHRLSTFCSVVHSWISFDSTTTESRQVAIARARASPRVAMGWRGWRWLLGSVWSMGKFLFVTNIDRQRYTKSYKEIQNNWGQNTLTFSTPQNHTKKFNITATKEILSQLLSRKWDFHELYRCIQNVISTCWSHLIKLNVKFGNNS